MLNENKLNFRFGRAAQGDDEFAAEVLAGLASPQKRLPCRFFYDDLGSRLFEEITQLPEYYPTRTERSILRAHAPEMVEDMPHGSVLVEFGSGSSLKTEVLLEQLPRLGAYVSIDVSPGALQEAAMRLSRRFPALDIRPIVADFSYPPTLPTAPRRASSQAPPSATSLPSRPSGSCGCSGRCCRRGEASSWASISKRTCAR